MKELIEANPLRRLSAVDRGAQHAPKRSKETQTTLDSYFTIVHANKKKQRRKAHPAANKAKPSIATRTDKATVADSNCASNFSFSRTTKKFERLRREIQSLKDSSQTMRQPALTVAPD